MEHHNNPSNDYLSPHFISRSNWLRAAVPGAIIFLILLGALSARTGGSSVSRAILRITFWGTVAMGITALVGYLFNLIS